MPLTTFAQRLVGGTTGDIGVHDLPAGHVRGHTVARRTRRRTRLLLDRARRRPRRRADFTISSQQSLLDHGHLHRPYPDDPARPESPGSRCWSADRRHEHHARLGHRADREIGLRKALGATPARDPAAVPRRGRRCSASPAGSSALALGVVGASVLPALPRPAGDDLPVVAVGVPRCRPGHRYRAGVYPASRAAASPPSTPCAASDQMTGPATRSSTMDRARQTPGHGRTTAGTPRRRSHPARAGQDGCHARRGDGGRRAGRRLWHRDRQRSGVDPLGHVTGAQAGQPGGTGQGGSGGQGGSADGGRGPGTARRHRPRWRPSTARPCRCRATRPRPRSRASAATTFTHTVATTAQAVRVGQCVVVRTGARAAAGPDGDAAAHRGPAGGDRHGDDLPSTVSAPPVGGLRGRLRRRLPPTGERGPGRHADRPADRPTHGPAHRRHPRRPGVRWRRASAG